MTLADLERTIASQAPGALIPRDWVLDQIREVTGADVGDELSDLSVEEAGELLARSASTVREYCRAGLLEGAYRQRGREWRVPRGAIRRFQRAEAAVHEKPAERKKRRGSGPVDLGSWRNEVKNEAA
jgi:hypothetical protein